MNTNNVKNSKEPWFAVCLSMCLAGLGQIYSGRVVRGCVFIFAEVASFSLWGWFMLRPTGNLIVGIGFLLTFIFINIYNLFDAHKCAREANTKIFEVIRKNNKDPWLTVFLSQIFPGWGHIYIGNWVLGIVFIVCSIIMLIFEDTNYVLFLLIFTIFSAFVCYHAYMSSPVRRETSKKPIMVLVLIFTLGLPLEYSANFISENHGQAFKIASRAMEPTLLVGDRIRANKIVYEMNTSFIKSQQAPNRGDVVVFELPIDESKNYIKRIVGIGGDLVEIRNKQVYLNGEPWDDPYGMHEDSDTWPGSVSPRDNYGPVTVPEDSLFVMGDNRDSSRDSRYWGFVALEKVKGKARNIIFSWDKERVRVRWERIGKDIK